MNKELKDKTNEYRAYKTLIVAEMVIYLIKSIFLQTHYTPTSNLAKQRKREQGEGDGMSKQ